mmetsp:Transcript_57743/g.162874  ORF Transcript_57743/g.162874 Transcript_57743/m.162874 type:complete len:293 (-) Transcript_57743:165-1043(-)
MEPESFSSPPHQLHSTIAFRRSSFMLTSGSWTSRSFSTALSNSPWSRVPSPLLSKLSNTDLTRRTSSSDIDSSFARPRMFQKLRESASSLCLDPFASLLSANRSWITSARSVVTLGTLAPSSSHVASLRVSSCVVSLLFIVLMKVGRRRRLAAMDGRLGALAGRPGGGRASALGSPSGTVCCCTGVRLLPLQPAVAGRARQRQAGPGRDLGAHAATAGACSTIARVGSVALMADGDADCDDCAGGLREGSPAPRFRGTPASSSRRGDLRSGAVAGLSGCRHACRRALEGRPD